MSCAREYDVLLSGEYVGGLDRDDERPTCPGCDSGDHVVLVATTKQPPEGSGYPYFCRGLGIEVTSAQHRRQVLKDRGLVCYEGEMESVIAEQKRGREKQLAAAKAEEDEIKRDPGYAEHMRLTDRGFFRDEEARIIREVREGRL